MDVCMGRQCSMAVCSHTSVIGDLLESSPLILQGNKKEPALGTVCFPVLAQICLPCLMEQLLRACFSINGGFSLFVDSTNTKQNQDRLLLFLLFLNASAEKSWKNEGPQQQDFNSSCKHYRSTAADLLKYQCLIKYSMQTST